LKLAEWSFVSRVNKVTPEILLSYTQLPWDWIQITRRPEITMEFIESHPELPWIYNEIALNPNLTLEYLNKWFDKIISNNMLFQIANNEFLKNNIALENHQKKIFKRWYNRVLEKDDRLYSDLINFINLY
jgi:hypothetical protein